MNRFSSLKQVQHFDALNSNQKKKEKEKRMSSLDLFGTPATLRIIFTINEWIST